MFTSLAVKAIKRVGPVTEHHLAGSDERTRLNIALDAVGLPQDGAVAHTDGAEPMVTAAYEGRAVLNGHSTHAGSIGLEAPAQRTVFGIDAIDEAVGRACHKHTLADSWRADDASSCSISPPPCARRVIANHTPGIVGGINTFPHNHR